MLNPNDIFDNRYILISNLGIGGYAEVWKAEDAKSGLIIALKIFHKQNKEGIELCKSEFLKTIKLEHPNILKPLHFDVFDDRPYLVMPFMSGGTVQSKIENNQDLSTSQLIEQIGGALKYIHSQIPAIVHADLKPDNILIDESGNLKLSDFGLSLQYLNILTQSVDQNNNEQGITPISYRAPELFSAKDTLKSDVSPFSDIWSFGAVLYFVKYRALPFNGGGGFEQRLLLNTSNGGSLIDLLALDKFYNDDDNFILNCLQLNGNKRNLENSYDYYSELEYTTSQENTSKLGLLGWENNQPSETLRHQKTLKDNDKSTKLGIIVFCLIGVLGLAGLIFMLSNNTTEVLDKTIDVSKLDSLGVADSIVVEEYDSVINEDNEQFSFPNENIENEEEYSKSTKLQVDEKNNNDIKGAIVAKSEEKEEKIINNKPHSEINLDDVEFFKTGTAGVINSSCKGKKSVTSASSINIKSQKKAELSYVKVAAEATCNANITITSNDGKKAVQMRNRQLNEGLINEINFQHLGYVLKPGVVYTITISPADINYKVSDLSECNVSNGPNDLLDISYSGGKVLFGLVYKY